jgi:putative hydroxymethylpyrimidine transport system substrate-binding protein
MTEIPRRALPAVASLLLPGMAAAQTSAPATGRLTLLLDWFVNPDHAPIIVAEEAGIFRAAGLEVRIVAPADPNDPPRLVAARQADIGVYYQKNLHLAVDQGLPLVRVGTLIGTPLSTVTVLRDGPIRTPADLRGRTIGYSVAGFEEVVLNAMLAPYGMSVRDVRLVAVNFALSSALMSGQVDAIIGGFRNFELHQLDIENRPGRAFYPEQHGLPIYDELIYVSHRDRARDPLIRRFLDAIETATAFLVNNPEEAWRMFIAGPRRELDNELNRRAWGSTITRFAHSPSALDQNRYARFARFLHERRMIRSVPPLERYAVEVPPAA